jgi:ribosomal protein L7/L12
VSEISEDLPQEEAPSDAPVEVSEDSGQGVSESDFSLEEESTGVTSADYTATDQKVTTGFDVDNAESLGEADSLSLTGIPGVTHSEDVDLTLDEPGFSEQGQTMVPPSRSSKMKARPPEPEPEPEAAPLPEPEPEAQPLDALSSSLAPVKFHDPSTDNLEQPDMQEKRPAPAMPPQKRPMPAPQAAPSPPAEELPPWTGRARDYRDPKLEAKKAATSKLNKSDLAARQAPPPAPQPSAEEPMSLSLEEEAPPPAPISKRPTAPVKAGPAPAAKPAPAPMAQRPAPVAAKPAPAPAARPAPAPVAAKPAPAAAKPPAPAPKPATKVPEGNFTVFLSPPKGAEKKQAAAEIIAEVQGIDLNAANALAGKMIVPVVKGVTEEEANKVRDRLKDAGLSCRITQKR